MNDKGVVVFTAIPGNRHTATEVFIGSGGPLTLIASANSRNSLFATFGNVSINVNDTVAFLANRKNGVRGVYIPMPSKSGDLFQGVVETGMSLFGSTVTGVAFGEKGLNNLGQVVFRVDLADGRHMIVRADPLPGMP